MTEKSHLANFAEFVIGDDNSELGIARSERDYALHCLERELAIAQQEQSRSAALVEALMEIRLVANAPGNRRALVDKIYGIATGACRSVNTPADDLARVMKGEG